MKSEVLREPRTHVGVFVSSIIVHNAMDIQFLRRVTVNSAQKFQEFLVTMTRKTLSDNFSFQNIECGKERGGATWRL